MAICRDLDQVAPLTAAALHDAREPPDLMRRLERRALPTEACGEPQFSQTGPCRIG